jgi:hypothetical protein
MVLGNLDEATVILTLEAVCKAGAHRFGTELAQPVGAGGMKYHDNVFLFFIERYRKAW